ncbi:hypothetical protein FHR90_002067 [Endobacter medicaginis]|jgi:hypothetical protein|uniref:Pectate lyase superfamily protein domain-containing protein n=1 Tax=Endobacter medicaginis TaxID=1181271 RepID=A0A839V428_9PROT|nr:hypothetical protein [Endobacter medicaginis]MBB3174231.1 hypothetical protein [Endobacter medicaginis]MCX5474275.1 hypothetical protein [Endobacter medicaginis]NVN30626.1 hypothetical protein [Endobacter medicaginis]
MIISLAAAAGPALGQPVFSRAGDGQFNTITGRSTAALPNAVARTLADHFADVVSIRDFGARCDGVTDDSAAVQTALNVASGMGYAKVTVPRGSCLIGTAISLSIGASSGVFLEGSNGSTLLFPGGVDGPSIALNAGTATFSAANLRFIRLSDGKGAVGTGLSIRAASGVVNSIPTHLTNLSFMGLNRADTWNVGLSLVSLVNPTIDALNVQQPDATMQASGPVGMIIQGLSNQQFAIDAKISNSTFQGGHINLQLIGSVQGVFITNSEGIGSDYGIYGVDDGTHYAELATVNNSHWNNTTAGIYLSNWNENNISNNLFLHFNPVASGNYGAVQLLSSGYNTLTANTTNGGGVGSETFARITNGQFEVVSNNAVVFLNGPCFDLGTSIRNATISANTCSGVSVSTPAVLPTGSGIVMSGNGYNGNVGDMGLDGNGNMQIAGSAVFSPQLVLTNAGNASLSFRDGNGALRSAINGNKDGTVNFGGGSPGVTLAAAGQALGFYGHATAAQTVVTGASTSSSTLNQILTALAATGLVGDTSTHSNDFTSTGNLFSSANIYPGNGGALILRDSAGSAAYLSPDSTGGAILGSLKSGGTARLQTSVITAQQQLNLPTTASVPSTASPTVTGTTSLLVDTADSKLCALIGSTWKCTTLQ